MVLESVRNASGTPAFARASVFVAGCEIAYRRAGTGRPVLILVEDDPARARLARSLAGVARVIVPERLPGDTSAASCAWIGGLLDGLGLRDAGIVADEANGLAGLTLTLADPDRAGRLAILLEPAGSTLVGALGIEDRLASTGQRVLLVGRENADAASRDGDRSAAEHDPDSDPSAGERDNEPAWAAAIVGFLSAEGDRAS